MKKPLRGFWIAVASRDHVENGKTMGIAQFCHGKIGPAKKVSRGDWVIYYSSKVKFGESMPCQQFTAIGQVTDDAPYQVQMSKGFKPFRRNVRYLKSEAVEIKPLLEKLKFIKDKIRWGSVFRYGFLEIDQGSFERIALEMTHAKLEDLEAV